MPDPTGRNHDEAMRNMSSDNQSKRQSQEKGQRHGLKLVGALVLIGAAAAAVADAAASRRRWQPRVKKHPQSDPKGQKIPRAEGISKERRLCDVEAKGHNYAAYTASPTNSLEPQDSAARPDRLPLAVRDGRVLMLVKKHELASLEMLASSQTAREEVHTLAASSACISPDCGDQQVLTETEGFGGVDASIQELPFQ